MAMDNFYNYLRVMVKTEMESKGLTAKDLAEQSNVSYTSINNYLKGRTFCLVPNNFTRVLNTLQLCERVQHVMIGYKLGRSEIA